MLRFREGIGEGGGHDAQGLFRCLDERDAFETPLHLRPVVLQPLAHAPRVEIEALMQEDEEEEVGLSRPVGSLGELLQEIDPATALSSLMFEELAQLVDDDQQPTGTVAFDGTLQTIDELE